MSSGDLIVIAVISLMVIGAILVLWNNYRKGRNSCGCNCSGCPRSATCKSPNVEIEDCDCCKKN
ncbi:hypothetical protein PED39_07970 [Methanomassiliicoccales archaeon LGM-RCC1]|nr:hypothetical protein [Candidatus Methanomethylophilaceae archaeon]WII07519.1 hypothetical protein PED39_07970 [Methanomassiliicoccales archaeon LGM-RCC1]